MNWPDDFVNKIICGDCLEVLTRVPSNSIDLIFADPPFNVGKEYGIHSDNRKDYKEWTGIWIQECFRILKDAGSFYLMTLTKHLEWKMPIMAKYGIFISLISWRNVSASHDKRRFWGEYQPIMLYGKTDKYKFNTYVQTRKISWPFFTEDKIIKYKGQMLDRWDDIPFIYVGSIYHKEAILKPNTNQKAHPCQMPLGLAIRAILFSSDEENIIMDPFSGSGTTARAAKDLRRNFIGIEINPDYCKIAEERLAQGVL